MLNVKVSSKDAIWWLFDSRHTIVHEQNQFQTTITHEKRWHPDGCVYRVAEKLKMPSIYRSTHVTDTQ